MKITHQILLSTVALCALASSLHAQEPRREGPPPGGADRRPAPPLMAALDANKDGEIDAAELANASAALKALDKNGDGKLSGEEIRPPRGPGGPEPRGERRGPEEAPGGKK
ncbi:MAG: EF-hand domain-containing protein [Verrucomicrobiota bacterium]